MVERNISNKKKESRSIKRNLSNAFGTVLDKIVPPRIIGWIPHTLSQEGLEAMEAYEKALTAKETEKIETTKKKLEDWQEKVEAYRRDQ